jgi:hypothetical protein
MRPPLAYATFELEETVSQYELSDVLGALRELVERCDGDEGVRADGSNIQTMRAHAILEAFLDEPDDVVPLEREDYCGECGQVGCSHDGLDRSTN